MSFNFTNSIVESAIFQFLNYFKVDKKIKFIAIRLYICILILVHLNMNCSVDQECSQWIPHSICSLNTCNCEEDYLAKDRACVPSINIYCLSSDSCKVNHSVCIDNICQCKPRYIYRYSRCIPRKYRNQ